ncbi:hypothetical protein BDK51DRAFT_30522 [Blyttiomyces helicus]|uniref:Uncharacterized protein n=1 Tax=Blyttiomyces helicus TaxID=388810 RepID=A0A4V1IR13_9FUNG|nr:hypothetical protein BDK51DRAFT_30522 [Blyttiomyces helicus]|eukprot:RKO88457.1 hypothetical protein BDK51DRAFT_30522 [Blyttiomyces helicus]
MLNMLSKGWIRKGTTGAVPAGGGAGEDACPSIKWSHAFARANPVPRPPTTDPEGILDFDSDDELSDFDSVDELSDLEEDEAGEENVQRQLENHSAHPWYMTGVAVTAVRHVDVTRVDPMKPASNEVGIVPIGDPSSPNDSPPVHSLSRLVIFILSTPLAKWVGNPGSDQGSDLRGPVGLQGTVHGWFWVWLRLGTLQS